MAYDLFLEQAMDNLDPADVLLFNLQFEEIGGAEIVPTGSDWSEFAPFLAQTRNVPKWLSAWLRMKMQISIRFLPVC